MTPVAFFDAGFDVGTGGGGGTAAVRTRPAVDRLVEGRPTGEPKAGRGGGVFSWRVQRRGSLMVGEMVRRPDKSGQTARRSWGRGWVEGKVFRPGGEGSQAGGEIVI